MAHMVDAIWSLCPPVETRQYSWVRGGRGVKRDELIERPGEACLRVLPGLAI